MCGRVCSSNFLGITLHARMLEEANSESLEPAISWPAPARLLQSGPWVPATEKYKPKPKLLNLTDGVAPKSARQHGACTPCAV